MAGAYKHIKFFRFRSPCHVDNGGREYPVTWLIRSLEYIDFDYNVLVVEAFAISYYSKGGFTFQDICNMEFDLYELVLKEADRISKLKAPSLMEESDE